MAGSSKRKKRLAWILTFILLLAGNIFCLISVDNTSNGSDPATSQSFTWTHTCSNSATCLVVGLQAGAGAPGITSVTYNGIPMTLAGTANSFTSTTIFIYYLMNPPTGGSYPIVVNPNAVFSWNYGAVSYNGVGAIGAEQQFENSSSMSIGLSYTTIATNSWIAGMVGSSTVTSITPGSGITSRWTGNTAGIGQQSDYATTAPGPYDITYTFGLNGYNALAAVELMSADEITPTITPTITPVPPFVLGNLSIITNTYAYSMSASNRLVAYSFTERAAKTVNDIKFYVMTGAGTAPTYNVAIMGDSGGYPNWVTLTSGTFSTSGWNDVAVPNATLNAGQVYHIVFTYNSGTVDGSDYLSVSEGTLPSSGIIPYDQVIDPNLNSMQYNGASCPFIITYRFLYWVILTPHISATLTAAAVVWA